MKKCTKKRIKVVNLKIEVEKMISHNTNILSSSSDAIDLALQIIDNNDRNMLISCCMNDNFEVINVNVVAIGNSEIYKNNIRDILKVALISNSNHIILVQYYPISNIKKSNVYFTKAENLKRSSDLVGINLIDYIELGYDKSFCSLN